MFKDNEMMRVLFHRLAASVFAAALLFVVSTASAQYTNGIYAEFNTSMGSFTCRLEYAIAPKTVGNFIGLATGQRPWLNVPTGQVRTNPFYNGTTFHRVIAGFMNQGGSPNGMGTDGPGYAFIDEFTSLQHDGFGVLSMANSGPDSNGSQFFITVSPQPSLNNVHSVFGKLHGGSNVVYAINHVATDANDKPLTNVVLQSVVIQRVGASAEAFDIHAQSLPLVNNLNSAIVRSGTNTTLTFSNQLYADNRVYFGPTVLGLTNYSPRGIEVNPPVLAGLQLSPTAPSQFYRMVQIQYPSSTLAPKNVLNRTMVLLFSNGVTITNSFNGSGGGTYTSNTYPPGTTAYNWSQEPYRGRFSPIIFSTIGSFNLRMDFVGATNGTFVGNIGFNNVAGAFTLTSP
jgi:peptidyl-prolyl cis-trans isomerase A (cyclophilin A)